MTTWLPDGTVKLVYLLRGLRSDLRDPALRGALGEAGAVRLQVNVDDAQVAPAMRFHTGVEAFVAMVSVWSPAPVDRPRLEQIAAALSEYADEVAGWRVDERRRLDPPESYDGARAPALANVAVLRRPGELSAEAWLQRWMIDHTPVAIRTQASLGYLQNIVVEPVTLDAPPVDGIVEELFPEAGMSDPHAFYGSDGDPAELERRLSELLTSVARIGADRDLDLVPTSRYLWDLG